MNAPKTPDAVLQLEAELVPVDVILPSSTHIQISRRKRFSEEGLLELAASIATSGVINPILLRPFPEDLRAHITPTPKYELIAGERRWLATKRAGLAHIPAVIRNLDDGQVLEAQLVENLQRENLNPLEEAEGYQELKQLKGYDAQQIGDLIGKSKSYVYARMKLNALSADARKAMEAGDIDFSKGLLLARINSPKLQEKALKLLNEKDWNGEPISYKKAFTQLRQKFMAQLGEAPFAPDDPHLFQFVKAGKGREDANALPICTDCPHNSANDPDLQRDLGSDAHVCTSTECFELKVVAYHRRRREEAERQQQPVISGDDAKKIFPRQNTVVGYVDLDDRCDYDEFLEDEPEAKNDVEFDSPEFQEKLRAWNKRLIDHRERTYRQLLGEHKLEVKLVEDPKTKKLRELVPINAARELLAKKHKIEVPNWVGKPPTQSSSGGFDHAAYERQQAEQRERAKREEEYRAAVLVKIAEVCAGPLTRDDLIDVADVIAGAYGAREGLKKLYEKVPEPGQLKDAELGKFIRLALVAGAVLSHNAPGPLLALAKRYKVDTAKIKNELQAARKTEVKAEAAPAGKKKTAVKGAKKKAAPKKTVAAKKAAKK